MKSKMRGGGAVSFNMTPMIDIVFNLIIFFMLVSQFYQLKVEAVKLPPAAKADPKRKELPNFTQVVINVVPPGSPSNPTGHTTLVKIDGKVVMRDEEGGDVPDPEPLENLLKARKEAAEAAGGGKPVNIILRAGDEVHYDLVARIMIAASRAGIPYWWVQAARPNPKENMDLEIKQFLGVPAKLD